MPPAAEPNESERDDDELPALVPFEKDRDAARRAIDRERMSTADAHELVGLVGTAERLALVREEMKRLRARYRLQAQNEAGWLAAARIAVEAGNLPPPRVRTAGWMSYGSILERLVRLARKEDRMAAQLDRARPKE